MTTIVFFDPKKCIPQSFTVHYFDRLMLVPGINHYDDEQLAELQSHGDYERYINWGAIVIKPQSKAPPPPPEESESPAKLAAYSVEDAQELISMCSDVDELEDWLKAEPRKTLRRDINARIAQIKAGNE